MPIFNCIRRMSFFLIEDRSAYRKWVNVVTSMLLPGSGIFYRGTARRRTAEGDHIIINEWQYRVSAPQRGDLIVFRTEAIGETERERFRIPSNEIYVKRLVGLPGEHVSIQPPSIYINGQKLVEPKILKISLFKQTRFRSSPLLSSGIEQTSNSGPTSTMLLATTL